MTMNFIEELYYGNINPNEKCFEKDTQFAKALERFCENESKLTEALTGENLKLFIDMVKAADEITACTSVDNFKIGFILGMRMMIDYFRTDENAMFRDM